MVCLYVCMYVSKQGRHVIFIVYANKDITYTHNVPAPPPPPVGGLGGVLPSAAMYRYNYMFVLIYVWELFVCIDLWFVCMYVCMYMCTQGRYIIFIVYANKDTTYTHNVPAPPLWVGWGGLTICSHV